MRDSFRDLTPAQSHLCDVIRFLAALAVALHHTLDHIEYEPYGVVASSFHTNLGSIGVLIFFLLSGFLITHTVGRKTSRGAYGFREYFVERSVRIYLVYAPAIVLALAITVALGTAFQARDASLDRLITNVLMLQGVPPFSEHAETFALLGPSWTLNYEFWLYMMFGLAALPAAGRRARVAGGIAAIVIAYLYMSLNHPVLMGVAWIAGALIAYAYQQVRMPFAAGLAVAVGALAGAGWLRVSGAVANEWDMYVTIAATVVAFCALMLSMPDSPAAARRTLAHRLAAYSYSLYLTHMIWLFLLSVAAEPLIDRIVAQAGVAVAAVLVLLIVNAGAWLFALATEAHNERVRRAILARLASRDAVRSAAARLAGVEA